MAHVKCRNVVYAFLVLCLLQTDGSLALQPNHDDTVAMEVKENDVLRVDDKHMHGLPDDAVGIDLPSSVPEIESKLTDSFQRCMVGCINADLCCSCSGSGKKPMVVAMVNQLTADCATSDDTDCTSKWVRKNLEPNWRGRASNCTRPDIVARNVRQCASHCDGRPLSKPLNPKYPLYRPGYLGNNDDLSSLPAVDLTDFCEDIRAEGFFCVSYRSDSFTAGMSMCRANNRCGYHGYKYSWCYVSWSNHWDYCCTGPCGFGQETSYEWCRSGNKWQYCGEGAKVDVKDRACAKEYPCGMHQEVGKASYYWCYVDHNKNWGRCCQPWHPCGKHGYGYDWCYTGYKRKTQWKHCVP